MPRRDRESRKKPHPSLSPGHSEHSPLPDNRLNNLGNFSSNASAAAAASNSNSDNADRRLDFTSAQAAPDQLPSASAAAVSSAEQFKPEPKTAPKPAPKKDAAAAKKAAPVFVNRKPADLVQNPSARKVGSMLSTAHTLFTAFFFDTVRCLVEFAASQDKVSFLFIDDTVIQLLLMCVRTWSFIPGSSKRQDLESREQIIEVFKAVGFMELTEADLSPKQREKLAAAAAAAVKDGADAAAAASAPTFTSTASALPTTNDLKFISKHWLNFDSKQVDELLGKLVAQLDMLKAHPAVQAAKDFNWSPVLTSDVQTLQSQLAQATKLINKHAAAVWRAKAPQLILAVPSAEGMTVEDQQESAAKLRELRAVKLYLLWEDKNEQRIMERLEERKKNLLALYLCGVIGLGDNEVLGFVNDNNLGRHLVMHQRLLKEAQRINILAEPHQHLLEHLRRTQIQEKQERQKLFQLFKKETKEAAASKQQPPKQQQPRNQKQQQRNNHQHSRQDDDALNALPQPEFKPKPLVPLWSIVPQISVDKGPHCMPLPISAVAAHYAFFQMKFRQDVPHLSFEVIEDMPQVREYLKAIFFKSGVCDFEPEQLRGYNEKGKRELRREQEAEQQKKKAEAEAKPMKIADADSAVDNNAVDADSAVDSDCEAADTDSDSDDAEAATPAEAADSDDDIDMTLGQLRRKAKAVPCVVRTAVSAVRTTRERTS